jgi:hypothetical protein
VSSIIKCRHVNQSNSYLAFHYVPFANALYLNDESGSDPSLSPNSNDTGKPIRAMSPEKYTDGNKIFRVNRPLCVNPQNLQSSSGTDECRYFEILLVDGTLRSLRKHFIQNILLKDVMFAGSGNKKLKLDAELSSTSQNDDNDSLTVRLNQNFGLLCKFPPHMDVIHDGFVDSRSMYICLRNTETYVIDDACKQLKSNLCVDFDALPRNLTSLLNSGNQRTDGKPLSVKEIFQKVAPLDIDEIPAKFRAYADRKLNGRIHYDYFSDTLPDIASLRVTENVKLSNDYDELLNSKEPIIALFSSSKKKIKHLLLGQTNVNSVPRISRYVFFFRN